MLLKGIEKLTSRSLKNVIKLWIDDFSSGFDERRPRASPRRRMPKTIAKVTRVDFRFQISQKGRKR